MTSDIKLSNFIERLKESVINPGVLFYGDVEKDGAGTNPYLESSVKSGKIALINSGASSLEKIDGTSLLNYDVFRILVNEWNPEKLVRMTLSVNKLMYSVNNEENKRRTLIRRLDDSLKLINRWTKEYGKRKMFLYVIQFINCYGIKLLKQKIKNRLF